MAKQTAAVFYSDGNNNFKNALVKELSWLYLIWFQTTFIVCKVHLAWEIGIESCSLKRIGWFQFAYSFHSLQVGLLSFLVLFSTFCSMFYVFCFLLFWHTFIQGLIRPGGGFWTIWHFKTVQKLNSIDCTLSQTCLKCPGLSLCLMGFFLCTHSFLWLFSSLF